MAKVSYPLQSGDVQGRFGRNWIHKKGGIVTRYFVPRDPRTIKQLAARDAFREMVMSGLTQAEADLLYAAIAHLHEEDYSGLEHDHNWLYSLLSHLHDSNYAALAHDHNSLYSDLSHLHDSVYVPLVALKRVLLPLGVYGAISPIASDAYPYSMSVDRTYVFVKWQQVVRVMTTNNSTNYWTVRLTRGIDGAEIAKIETKAMAASTFVASTVSSFSIPAIGLSDERLYVRVVKTGTPGTIELIGPLVEATC
jgi:hypothetical protein